jgi:hypothetical protein
MRTKPFSSNNVDSMMERLLLLFKLEFDEVVDELLVLPERDNGRKPIVVAGREDGVIGVRRCCAISNLNK